MNDSIHALHETDLHPGTDQKRRELLLTATGILGTASLIAAGLPFVASMEPSAAALAAGGPVDVDTSSMQPGDLRVVSWRGKPVWIMRRTEDMVRALQATNGNLVDPMSKRSIQPASCANPTRSERPDMFVAIGVCTHLGCSPRLELHNAALNAELHAPGGFLCPCHGSRFDLAGRVVKDVPAPTNLDIPDYRYLTATSIRIG